MMHCIAKTDLLPILKDLALCMPGAKDRDPLAMLDGYHDALDDCTLVEVQGGARTVKRDMKFFPAAASLRRHALEYRKEHPVRREGTETFGTPMERMQHWANTGMAYGEPCPYCGSVLACVKCGRLLTHCDGSDGGRLGVQHDTRMHQEKQVPAIGYREYVTPVHDPRPA